MPTPCVVSLQELPFDCCGCWDRLANRPWSEVRVALHLSKPPWRCAWARRECNVCIVDHVKTLVDQHLSGNTTLIHPG